MARLAIYLEIEGTDEDAFEVVDMLLDNGVPQDSINDHQHSDCGPLHVKTAIVRYMGDEQWTAEVEGR